MGRTPRPRRETKALVAGGNPRGQQFDVHPDGKRVAVLATRARNPVQEKVVFVSNFFDHLRVIAPGRKSITIPASSTVPRVASRRSMPPASQIVSMKRSGSPMKLLCVE